MPKNGEKANWQGNMFRDSCELLVKKIGYEEIFSGKFGIDLAASPPKGWPKNKLLRPSFSPEGNTAFEFTSEFNIGEGALDELSNKIEKLGPEYKITGGILICNIRAADNLIEYGIKKSTKVFVWDYRYSKFLSTKFMICEMWSKIGSARERYLDNNVAYLWCLERLPSKEIFQSRIGVFFDNPLLEVGSRELDETVKRITQAIEKDGSASGYLPIQINTTIFTIGFIRKDLFNRIDHILKKYSSENIAYVQSEGPIREFYVAPFCSDLIMTV
jgi:hypothetical protein